MSTNTIQLRTALGNVSDLTTPTLLQNYVLGTVVEIIDDTYKSIKKFMYVKSHGTLTIYNAYFIAYSSTAGSEVITVGATTSAILKIACIAPATFTSGYYGFVQIEGDCTVASTGNTTAGNTGKLADSVSTVTDETAATETASTIGVFKTTQSAGAANVSFCLQGKWKRSSVA
jgi:hypothetical protein